MAMPITSRDTPSNTNITPGHASVAKNIRAAPINTSSTANKRLVDGLISTINPNDSSKPAPDFHLKYDQPLAHLGRRAALPHLYP